jgi:hypothetical protein
MYADHALQDNLNSDFALTVAQPGKAAEAAAAYVDNVMMSHWSGSSLPLVDAAAVTAIEDREKEMLYLRGQAKDALAHQTQLEKQLGEVMSELDERRLEVACLLMPLELCDSVAARCYCHSLANYCQQVCW